MGEHVVDIDTAGCNVLESRREPAGERVREGDGAASAPAAAGRQGIHLPPRHLPGAHPLPRLLPSFRAAAAALRRQRPRHRAPFPPRGARQVLLSAPPERIPFAAVAPSACASDSPQRSCMPYLVNTFSLSCIKHYNGIGEFSIC